MRVLVIGSGAREHALLHGLAADPLVDALACAPGNAGTGELAENLPVATADARAVASLATSWAADLVVVGPEVPLVAGAADAVRAAGIACFGPSQAAAAIEGSKAFAKDVMHAAGVPTAGSMIVDNPARLDAALRSFGPHYVVKDDGLAAGKGVVVTERLDAARAHASSLLDDGHPVLLEEFLDGPELSVFCITDGTTVLGMQPAQDFKRVGEQGTGPNTGGMGAYAPLPWVSRGLMQQVIDEIAQPVITELAARGCPYSGVLYAGLALTSSGPRVVEFNCRFGDPEVQAVLALLQTPLGGLLHAVATGELAAHPPLQWRAGCAVAVVLAAEGYPVRARTGDVLTGATGPGVLHAGTAVREDGAVVSAGGRVLTVVGTGADLAAAREGAYDRLAGIRLPGGHWRTDIAAAAAAGEIRDPGATDPALHLADGGFAS